MDQLPVSKGFSATLVKNGDKGDPAVSYQISLAGSRFWVDQDAVKMYVDIKGSILKSVGGTISPFTPTSSMLKLYFDGVGGRNNIPDADVTISGNTFSTTKYNGGVWDGENILVATLTIDGVTVASMSIQVELKGKQGTAGTSAKMCYIAGNYSNQIEYTSDARQTVAVLVPISGNNAESEVWTLSGATNVVNGVHIGPKDSGQRVWSQGLNGYNMIMTQFLFAAFANLGSFIVSGDFFISQYGTLYFGTNQQREIDASNYRHGWGVYNEQYLIEADTPDGSSKPAYMYFDSSDPKVVIKRSGKLGFKPTLCINARTGYILGGNMEITGTIRATNFYHKVCYYYGGGVCVNGGGQVSKTSEADGTLWYDTAGNADIIEILPTEGRAWGSWDDKKNNYTILLPSPSEYDGKIITVYCRVFVASGKICVGCVETNRMATQWEINSSGILQPIIGSGYSGILDAITLKKAFGVQRYKLSGNWGGSWEEEKNGTSNVYQIMASEYVFAAQNGYWFMLKG